MPYSKADELFFMQTIEKIAARKVYHRFRVNKYELMMLVNLSGYLQLFDRQVVSYKIFINWLGYNSRYRAKCWAYLRYLIDKGILHRLTFKNQPEGTGNSLALSAYGIRVLNAFYEEVDKLERENKHRKKGRSYIELVVHSDQLPHGYTLRTAGRND